MLNKFAVLKKFLKRDFCSEVVKSFNEIPGPRGIFGIGNFYNYTSLGNYSFDRLHESGFDKYQKYGEIVKERMVPGVDVVWLFNPNDIAKIFSDGVGNYPCRRSHLALEKYRRDRPHIYRTAGLLPTNGCEWWKIRSEFQKGLSSVQNVRNFLPYSDDVTVEFFQELEKRMPEDCVIADMLPEVSRLNLELTCLLAFDERMDSLSDIERTPDSRSSKLMEAAEVTNQSILPTDQGFQLWRFFETSAYKKLRESQEYMEGVGIDLIKKKMNRLKDQNDRKLVEKSLIEQYLSNPNLGMQDIIGMAADLLLAGVHTGSFSTAFALHYISLNPAVQDKMFEEAIKILPDKNGSISVASINSDATYIRAVLKETFRLNPISIGVGRILNKDLILGGYQVPKNTVVVSQNFVSCRLEKYFKDPLKFIPERWIKSGNEKLNINPHLVLPFGHGMRSCIARRFAEQNIIVFLIRLMRNYKIEWKGSSEPLDVETKLINQPNKPITIKFSKREI